MMKYNCNVVAANIRSARLFRNYSQDYLALKLNISQNAYSKIELSNTKLSLDKLIIIAEVLDVGLITLIGTPTDKDEIETIAKAPVVTKLLKVACDITGMGFAAVVKAGTGKVVLCSVRNEIKIGLEPGREVHRESTMWKEILQSGKGVVIDHVDEDEVFSKHPVPRIYGFQSYIAVPVIRHDGTFFGALLAMDHQPRKVNDGRIIETFELFAELISCNLGL